MALILFEELANLRKAGQMSAVARR